MSSKLTVKNVLITGGSGFIGSNFLLYLSEAKNKASTPKKINNFYSKKLQGIILSPNHTELDIVNSAQLKEFFDTTHPEVVINFAAHRDANTAEKQRGDKSASAWKTNVVGVKNLLKICHMYNTFLIHISTDMVFAGGSDNPGPYSENTKPETDLKKLSWYGWTKAEAERALLSKKHTAIIRVGNVTKPVYDPKLDYVGKILYLFDQGKLYSLFYDQYLTLTYIHSLFEVIEILVKNKKSGVFHVASKNIFTPNSLARYLIGRARNKSRSIKKGISINEYLEKWPNRYPKYGGLLEKKTSTQLHTKSLKWEEIVGLLVSSFPK